MNEHRPGVACDETSPEALGTFESLIAEETPEPADRSGPHWVSRYPGSRAIDALAQPFQGNLQRFVTALMAAGAEVSIRATFRPPQRAYLMHWCCRIADGSVDPVAVPGLEGVPIDWTHDSPTAARAAAAAMRTAYGIAFPAALRSRHTQARAVDMTIRWDRDLDIVDGSGAVRSIAPGDGATSAELHAVGETYGVIKLVGDPPHWSDDGR